MALGSLVVPLEARLDPEQKFNVCNFLDKVLSEPCPTGSQPLDNEAVKRSVYYRGYESRRRPLDNPLRSKGQSKTMRRVCGGTDFDAKSYGGRITLEPIYVLDDGSTEPQEAPSGAHTMDTLAMLVKEGEHAGIYDARV